MGDVDGKYYVCYIKWIFFILFIVDIILSISKDISCYKIVRGFKNGNIRILI